ncbi:MAG: outer membrane protein assembly factor BamA, partial [Deltaproteobacteria bacterium]|nr:outer membrane protein assembly factor BamA [Deltaproteobacteria bacterium]
MWLPLWIAVALAQAPETPAPETPDPEVPAEPEAPFPDLVDEGTGTGWGPLARPIVVEKIVVVGTRRIEKAAVIAAVGVHEGDLLTAEKARRDLRAIYQTGFFRDVRLEIEPTTEGRGILTIQVAEKPAVRDVRISGNKKIDEDDIREVLDVKSFSVLNQAQVDRNIQEIRELYIDKGYYLVEIEVKQEPVGDDQVDVTFEIQENRKVIVQDVSFTGNENVPDNKISKFLAIKEGGPIPWLTSSGTFKQSELESDQQRISLVFLEEGYVEVQVDPPKVYLSPDKRFIYINYHITEGDQFAVGEVKVAGEFVPEEGLTEEALTEIMNGRPVVEVQDEQWREATGRRAPLFAGVENRGPRLETGETFKYSTVQQVLANLTALYEDQGYAFANIIPDTRTHPETKTVDVTFVAEHGEKYRIGRINVTGNDPTFDKVVRRELQIAEGDLYRGSLLQASRVNLERLGFFDEVNVSTPRGEEEGTLDFNVGVSEQPTGSFSLGMGYSNLENFTITANVSKNNFLGLGYQMAAAINWSGLRQQGNVSLIDPYFLDSNWFFQFDLYSVDRQYQLNEYQRGGSVSLGRYVDLRRKDIRVNLDYTFEDVGLTNIDPYRSLLLGGDLYRNGLTSSLGTSIVMDKRNNRLFPTQGFYTSAATSLAGGVRIGDDRVLSIFGGEFNQVETTYNFRFYQPLVPRTDNLVLRFNTTVGALFSTDGRPIAYIHRYRAGGINSVRGFNWYSLGPTIRSPASDDPIHADEDLIVGGTQTWINNLEIQTPIIRGAGIAGVVFFDAGNAFGDPWGEGNITPFGLRTAIGAGIRWQSPIGPLRFEYGV